MKKVLDIFVLLFLLASHSWAMDYRAFYAEANKAEIYIVEGEYEKASRVYSSALKSGLGHRPWMFTMPAMCGESRKAQGCH